MGMEGNSPMRQPGMPDTSDGISAMVA